MEEFTSRDSVVLQLNDHHNCKIVLCKEEKKTEHTNIAHTARNSEHQNIHVMLSYANKPKENKFIKLKHVRLKTEHE